MNDIPFNIQNIEKLLEINYLSNLIKSCEKNGLNKKYILEIPVKPEFKISYSILGL